MAPATQQLFQAALTLPEDERNQLIEALIAAAEAGESAPIDESWREVIQSRSAEIDAGSVQLLSWEELRERVHKRVGLDG